ncbi:MAG: hypothetical protein PsegKO_18720 [Pseudohongiellaceae bacterium]
MQAGGDQWQPRANHSIPGLWRPVVGIAIRGFWSDQWGQKWEYLWLQFRGFVNTEIEVPIINNQQNKGLEKKKEKHHN